VHQAISWRVTPRDPQIRSSADRRSSLCAASVHMVNTVHIVGKRRVVHEVVHKRCGMILRGLCVGEVKPQPSPPVASSDAAQAHRFSQSDIELYHSRGWVLTPPLLSPVELRTVRDGAMAAWKQAKANVDQASPGLTWLQAALLPSVHRLSPACKNYYWTGPHISLVQQLIGPNVKTSGTQLSFKMRGNSQVGFHIANNQRWTTCGG
jgi:hypothetical protein